MSNDATAEGDRMAAGQLDYNAKFVWDDGQGETTCTSDYFEARCFQRVALGKAAEARLAKDERGAVEYESKARAFALRLDDMRRAGHIGKNTRYTESEFRERFKNTTANTMSII